jgi:hypothetical protein
MSDRLIPMDSKIKVGDVIKYSSDGNYGNISEAQVINIDWPIIELEQPGNYKSEMYIEQLIVLRIVTRG